MIGTLLRVICYGRTAPWIILRDNAGGSLVWFPRIGLKKFPSEFEIDV